MPLPAWRQPLLASSLPQDKKWHDSGRKWGQTKDSASEPPWGPDRVWEDHCSSIPRVQQKHPIPRLLSGHAGDFSPFRHPDWGLVRCSFRPRPRKAAAPSPPTPTPSCGSSSPPCGQQTGPALPSLLTGKKKKETRKSSSRSSHPILCTSPDTSAHGSVVVTAAAERANKRHHPGQKSRPSTQLYPLRNRVSLPPLTAHATSPGLTVKSRRPGPML